MDLCVYCFLRWGRRALIGTFRPCYYVGVTERRTCEELFGSPDEIRRTIRCPISRFTP
jgi:hypothetical protein